MVVVVAIPGPPENTELVGDKVGDLNPNRGVSGTFGNANGGETVLHVDEVGAKPLDSPIICLSEPYAAGALGRRMTGTVGRR